MTPKQWTRIRAHLANEAADSHPQSVIAAVVAGLFEDALGPPPGVMDGAKPRPAPNNHASGGVAPLADKTPLLRAPGVVATDGRAPGGGEAPLCLFGPGGDFQTPWPDRSD